MLYYIENMVVLKMEKGFGKHIAPEGFLKNQPKYLTLHIISVTNESIKKTFNDSEPKVIKNIKKIKSASYGKGDNKLDVTDKIREMIALETNVDDFNRVNKDFADFCLVFMNVLCPRCYNTHTKKSDSQSTNNLHNCGYINFLMRSTSSEYYPHLFDGIIKCFVAYLIEKHNTKRWIEIFSHILLAKKGVKCPQYINDKCIEIHTFFLSNKLICNPSTNNYLTNSFLERLDNSIRNKLELFYSHIYPVLKYFYTNKTQIFIRHGLEKNTNDYSANMIYPHNDVKHGWRIHKVTDAYGSHGSYGSDKPTVYPAYAIETDKYPFKNCGEHSSKEIYGCVKGYITQNDYKRCGGIIHFRYENNNTIMSRDHLFGESEITINKWVFTYKMKTPERLKKEVKKAVKSLLNCKIPLAAEDYLEQFNIISELILNKFIILH